MGVSFEPDNVLFYLFCIDSFSWTRVLKGLKNVFNLRFWIEELAKSIWIKSYFHKINFSNLSA